MKFPYYLPNILIKVDTILYYKFEQIIKLFVYVFRLMILAQPFCLTRLNLIDS
jgi:hypothetical protein